MDKRVVFHIDDIWSSLSANRAALDLLKNGRATSWSIMVPCSGFSDAISKTKKIKNIDLWVHLTLTSEWLSDNLKWRPTLPSQEVPSLIDDRWYFLSSVDDILHKANPEEIKKELINQVEIAENSGIDISHLDSHMWVLFHKKLFPLYKDLANIFKIQPFLTRPKPLDTLWHWFYECDQYIDDLVSEWFNVFDGFDADSLYQWKKDYNLHCIDRIKSIETWTTYFLLHVLDNNVNDIEKTPDFLARQNEYNFFRSNILDTLIEDQDIKKIMVKEL